MTLRLEYRAVAPDAVKALRGLNDYIAGSTVPPPLRYLIETRVSEVNGCSYCIAVHRNQALDVGESVDRLDALRDWRGSDLFTPAERAALAWAEDLTLVAETGAPDATYRGLLDHFDEKEIVDLTFVVMSMNAWNRLAIGFRREAPTPE